jgi:putative FmdB family regulatory protein
MPLYSYKCQNGHKFDRFLKLADYDKSQTCECGADSIKQLSAPMFQVDFPAYQSPTSGKWITSRTQRNEDLKQSGCVEYEPSMKQEMERKHAAEDAALDKAVDEHVEKTIYEMPVQQRERLVAELESGVDVEVVRA